MKKCKLVKIKNVPIYIIIIIFTVFCLFPLFWIFLSSFKTNSEIMTDTLKLPEIIIWQNYIKAWENGKMINYYINTIVVALTTTLATLLISSMATYVLARVRPCMPLYVYFVSGLILPVYVIMLPLLKILNFINLANDLLGLILVYTAVLISQSFFVLYSYMKGIPHELEEAAVIDGCSLATIFFRIILPVTRPGLATVGTFALLFGWNEYLLPLVLINGNDRYVLSQAIRVFQQDYSTDYGSMTARIVLSILPVLLLYIIFQQNFVKGMTAGAVKG